MINRSRSRRMIFCCAIVGVALVGAYSVRQPILAGLGRWLNATEPIRSADFVMVLPGAAETRPFVATALVRSGWAKAVLTPRTVPSPDIADGIVPSEDQLFHAILRKRGIRDDQIEILPGASNSTYSDALALKSFLDSHSTARVVIVTSDYHVRRSRWIFLRVLADRAHQISFLAASTDEFQSDNWWKSQSGISTYASEYFKWGIYRVKYGSTGEWVTVAALIVLYVAIRVRARSRWARCATKVES